MIVSYEHLRGYVTMDDATKHLIGCNVVEYFN